VSLSLLLEIIRQRRRLVLLALLVTVVAVGLTSYRLAWQEPRLDSLRADWLGKRDAAGGLIQNPQEVYLQGKKDLENVKGLTPSQKEFVRLLGDLYELAANNRLVLGSVSYKIITPKDIKGGPLLAYELTLAADGGYAALKSFIADVERMDELVVIDGLAVSGGKEGAGPTVAAKIILTAYFRAEGA
jgi:Tfp pilus assembly protein PilO